MSEQIREQVSAFLDGELPSSETELLLKRLTRDPELRQSFGRYALIGETLRGGSGASLSLTFAARVNRTIDGEPAAPALPAARARPLRWWRPIAGTAVAAGVTAIAVVTWQQRAVAPSVTAAPRAQNVRLATVAKEPLSYTVPTPAAAPAMLAPARLTNYVFAHSKYSVGLGQSNLLATLLSEDADAVQSAAAVAGAGGNAPRASATTAVSPATQTAP
jgi:sigma-E factor negative regulatory protein RseA